MAGDQTIPDFIQRHLGRDTVEETLRQQELGPLGFGYAKPMIDTIRDILIGIQEAPEDDIPESVLTQTAQNLNAFDGTLARMRSFDVAASNPKAQRDQLISEATALRDYLIREVRPLLRVDQAKLLTLEAQLRDALDEARAAAAASSAAAADVRGSALEVTAEKFSHFYAAQASRHQDSAKGFQLGVIIGGGLAAVSVIAFFWLWPPKAAASGTNSLDAVLFVRESLLRLLLVGLVFVGLSFCLRNYRVNKHLQTLNEARANALETVGPLTRGAIASDAGREIVIHELVSAVFAIGDTGYVAGSGDHTVVESSNSLAAVLGAIRPGS